MENKEILLGSGRLYVVEFLDSIPQDADIEKAENQIGAISGGASVSYKPTFYTAKDDAGTVSKTIVTEEESTLKTGVCTFNGNTLAKLCSTARVTEENGYRIVKIGGIGNYDGKKYVIHFVHISGNHRVTIVGNNQSGFELAFLKDKETIVDAEFKALPSDTDGTQIIYKEKMPVSP